ncbi:hypothetical protein ACFQVA_17360 [Actinomadura keratinilytica]
MGAQGVRAGGGALFGRDGVRDDPGVPGWSSRTTAAACPTSGWEVNAVSISPSSMRRPRILTWSSVRPR